MKEELVSHNTAVLAEEKGFDWDCTYTYDYDKALEDAFSYTGEALFTKEDIENAKENGYTAILAPTQSLLQKWLREKHNLFVTVQWVDGRLDYSKQLWSYSIHGLHYEILDCDDHSNTGNTYEEALEQSLLEALKLLK